MGGDDTEPTPTVSAADERREQQRQALDRAERRAEALEDRVADLEKAIDETESTTEEDAATAPSAPTTPARPRTPSSPNTDDSFAALERRLGGRAGVTFGPLSGSATSHGSLTTGPAWSTIKVPIAIAVAREHGGETPSMNPAITASDNAAAARLWESLGPAATAGRKTQAVLADGGDTQTAVQTVVTRPFSAYGQTSWSLASQQRFARSLPCLRGARPVVSLMGQVISAQRWGLGSVGTNARFKGGWGPDESGRYLARQFGLIDLPTGTVAVAMAVEPADGSFDAATRNLTAVAEWVAERATGSPAGSCPSS